VLAQEIQIEQVILNLIRNAIEALESTAVHKREIILSTHLLTKVVDSDMLEIRVTDSGTGLNSEVQEHVFDPFVTTKLDGMGLGLSISQGIIEAHGDRIHVDSTAQGASFYFSLPLVSDAHKK
jgi:signal transduction histidine kinase